MTHCFAWMPAWNWLLVSIWQLSRRAIFIHWLVTRFVYKLTEWNMIFRQPHKPFRFIIINGTHGSNGSLNGTFWFSFSLWHFGSLLTGSVSVCVGGFYAWLLFVFGQKKQQKKIGKNILLIGETVHKSDFIMDLVQSSIKNSKNQIILTIIIFRSKSIFHVEHKLKHATDIWIER